MSQPAGIDRNIYLDEEKGVFTCRSPRKSADRNSNRVNHKLTGPLSLPAQERGAHQLLTRVSGTCFTRFEIFAIVALQTCFGGSEMVASKLTNSCSDAPQGLGLEMGKRTSPR